MSFIVSNKTIWQAFQINAQAIFSRLNKQAQSQWLFILYNNINFYKRVYNQRLHNKAYIVNYTTKYIYFINIIDGSPLLYINYDQVQYKVFNCLIASSFILDQINVNHQVLAICYILSCVLK